MTFHERTGSFAIARGAVTSFEVSNGGNAGRGAWTGLRIGLLAGVGAGIAYHFATRQDGPQFRYDRGDVMAAGLQGAALGAALGLSLGALAGRELWHSAPLPAADGRTLPPFDARPALQAETRFNQLRYAQPVRLQLFNGRFVHGGYAGHADGAVSLLGDSTHVVPMTDIARIAERRPMTGPFALRGALLGAGAAGALALAAVLAEDDDSDSIDPGGSFDPKGYIPIFVVSAGTIGALGGAFLGSMIHGWRSQDR